MPATPSYMTKTISSQGKLRKKPPTVVSAYSQGKLGRVRLAFLNACLCYFSFRMTLCRKSEG